MPFVPSKYQEAIFDFVINGRGDGLVNAVAGSGKSTTLVECAKRIKGTALFVAFNKHIAEHLSVKLEGTTCSARTIHSIGYGCVAKKLGKGLKVDDRKYHRLVDEYVDEVFMEWTFSAYDDDDLPTESEAASALKDLVNKVRVTLTNPLDDAAVAEVIDKYGIDIHPRLVKGVHVLLARGANIAQKRKEIDYTDMLYLPYLWQLAPPRFDHVLVDECQDLSAAQLDLVLKLRAPGGRMLFVGDERQAVFGFAGADAESFGNIKARLNATELPLSICYRCPTSHLDLAREIVPQIEARPDAPLGTIDYLTEDRLYAQVREGDMVLCRLTAPLVSMCIKLIAQRVPARVRGRDIGKQLAGMVRDVAKLHGFTYEQFPAFLEEYRRIHVFKLQKKDASEAQIESLNDRVDGVLACYDGFDAKTLDDLCKDIEGLFADGRISVTLSTVHKAKGLENDRVFIIKPNKLPLRYKVQKAWQLEQEYNLKYVALTRATEALYFVVEQTPVCAAEPAPEPDAGEASRVEEVLA